MALSFYLVVYAKRVCFFAKILADSSNGYFRFCLKLMSWLYMLTKECLMN